MRIRIRKLLWAWSLLVSLGLLVVSCGMVALMAYELFLELGTLNNLQQLPPRMRGAYRSHVLAEITHTLQTGKAHLMVMGLASTMIFISLYFLVGPYLKKKIQASRI